MSVEFDTACSKLRDGAVVAVPTDTVIGLAALASDPSATKRLFDMKGRDSTTAIAVLCADLEQAADIATWGEVGQLLAQRYWPGPLTLVGLRRAVSASWELGGDPASIGVRVPSHEFVRALAAELGPLATTSANRSGEPTVETSQAAGTLFGDQLSYIVDGRSQTVASTVVDVRGDIATVLRAGAIAASEIDAFVHGHRLP